MSDPKPCPTCRQPIPAGSPGGACPRCLLAAGLESGGAAAGAAPPPPEEMARHFPQLEVLEVLGQGGMGIVYKARHRNLDRMVALKVLSPETAQESGFADRFTREARTLARLQHPHIVGVHDFGETDGLYWLVMEFVDGPNLRQVIREGSLEATQALAIVPQVCDALQYAHEQGIVHRDIKPENILLDREGRVKIADFGLAKIVQRAPVDLTLTREGQVMGTLHYMAPEQYRAPDTVDHRADIFSLGVVFYEMLTGDLPMGVFPPPSRKYGLDARLDGVVMRALEKERDLRWQHASDVGTEVDSIAAGPAAEEGAKTPESARKKAHISMGPLKVDVEKDGKGKKTHIHVAGLPVDVEKARAAGAEVEEGKDGVHVTVQGEWKGGKEPKPGARLSWLAVTGVAAIPGALLLGVAAAAVHGDGGMAISWAMGTALVVLLAGWICSIAGWVSIRHSDGLLKGVGWAAAGTFGIPFLLCLGVPLTFFLGLYRAVEENPLGIHSGGPIIRVSEEGGRTSVSLPGIQVSEGPGHTSVRLPGIEVIEMGGRQTIRLPGIEVVSGERNPERAHMVTGGPALMTDLHREGVLLEMEHLWLTEGATLEFPSLDGEPRRAADWTVRAVALEKDGRHGRVVCSDGKDCISFAVVHDGLRWVVPREDRESRKGPFEESDRDGRLFSHEPDAALEDAAMVHGAPPGMPTSSRADLVGEIRALWKEKGPEFVRRTTPLETVGGEVRIPGNAADYGLHAVALAEGGAAARVVLASGSTTISVAVERDGDSWVLLPDGWEIRWSPPAEGDEDGLLFR